jgi:hypothetical protein
VIRACLHTYAHAANHLTFFLGTSRSLKASEAGKTYAVVIAGSPTINPGYKLVNNARYPSRR